MCVYTPCPRVLQASGTIVGEFQRQQEQFAREQQRQRGVSQPIFVGILEDLLFPPPDAAVPPWVGYNEEEEMRAQILELSAVGFSNQLVHSHA